MNKTKSNVKQKLEMSSGKKVKRQTKIGTVKMETNPTKVMEELNEFKTKLTSVKRMYRPKCTDPTGTSSPPPPPCK
jgi:hypothetical protein